MLGSKPVSWFWFDLRCWWLSRKERLTMWVVWHLPHQIVYWAYIRVHANATCGPFGGEQPDQVSWSEACRRWERREGGDRSFVSRA